MPKLTDYKPLKNNPNKGSKRGNDLLETSLEQGGLGRSIVVANNGDILGGNHVTAKVGELFGLDTPVLEVPTDGNTLVVVKRTDIPSANSPKGKHLILADNRVGDFHLYDLEALQEFKPEILEEYFFGNELALLEDDGTPLNYDEHWQGMPEFNQEDMSSWHSIKVHFNDEQALMAFAQLIGQTVTDKTKSIYYPKQIHADLLSKVVIDES